MSKKEKNMPKLTILVAVLAFVALSLLLHLATLGLSRLVPGVEIEETPHEQPSEQLEPLLPDLPEPEVPLSYDDEPAPASDETAQLTEPEPEPEPDPVPSVLTVATDEAHRLTIYAEELPAFDFSTGTVDDEHAQLFVLTADSTCILSLSAGEDRASLDDARDRKLAEYDDFLIPYSVSQRERSDTARVQAINVLSDAELYTEILVATPAGLLDFSINRTEDADGSVYAEVETFLRQRYDLSLPTAPEVTVPDDYESLTY